jgi:hypothetical protein
MLDRSLLALLSREQASSAQRRGASSAAPSRNSPACALRFAERRSVRQRDAREREPCPTRSRSNERCMFTLRAWPTAFGVGASLLDVCCAVTSEVRLRGRSYPTTGSHCELLLERRAPADIAAHQPSHTSPHIGAGAGFEPRRSSEHRACTIALALLLAPPEPPLCVPSLHVTSSRPEVNSCRPTRTDDEAAAQTR